MYIWNSLLVFFSWKRVWFCVPPPKKTPICTWELSTGIYDERSLQQSLPFPYFLTIQNPFSEWKKIKPGSKDCPLNSPLVSIQKEKLPVGHYLSTLNLPVGTPFLLFPWEGFSFVRRKLFCMSSNLANAISLRICGFAIDFTSLLNAQKQETNDTQGDLWIQW